MNKTYYVCKYTPIELLQAFGAECENLNEMPQGFDMADQIAHPNICGFGKALLEAVIAGKVKELVLVNCCDTIRSVYDVLEESGKLDFLYIVDMLHSEGSCSQERTVSQLKDLAKAYGEYKGREFDEKLFRKAFKAPEKTNEPYIGILGARMGQELYEMVQGCMPYPVRNQTCVNNRSAGEATPPENVSFEELLQWYAAELLGQLPCMRMTDNTKRKQLYLDPNLRGIIYHTVKFCDFYSFEYAQIKAHLAVPLLKIESDYTLQSSGQLLTRLEAFAESINMEQLEGKEIKMTKGYFAGIDSGSTSTDVVILNKDKEIVTSVILPTGAGAAIGAERALEEALKAAGLKREDIDAMVTTGYGRTAISDGDKSITEITCHARGAHFLDPTVRTVIDIGGQDSKVIRLDETGAVVNFVMNDKCAAGTGRFLDVMANILKLDISQLEVEAAKAEKPASISSTCTVFAESEVISQLANGTDIPDLVAGICQSVAARVASLAKRAGVKREVCMSGGVARNAGVREAMEKELGVPIIYDERAQIMGALGAALYAYNKVKNS